MIIIIDETIRLKWAKVNQLAILHIH